MGNSCAQVMFRFFVFLRRFFMDDLSVSAGGKTQKDSVSTPIFGSGIKSLFFQDAPLRLVYTSFVLLVGWALYQIVPAGSYHHFWGFWAVMAFAFWPWVTWLVALGMRLFRGFPAMRALLVVVRGGALLFVFGGMILAMWLTFVPEHEGFLALRKKAYDRVAPYFDFDLGWLTGRPEQVDWNQPGNWVGDTVKTGTTKRPVPPSESE
jgi:hypothetical protein